MFQAMICSDVSCRCSLFWQMSCTTIIVFTNGTVTRPQVKRLRKSCQVFFFSSLYNNTHRCTPVFSDVSESASPDSHLKPVDYGHIGEFISRFGKTIWDLVMNKITTLLSAADFSQQLSIDRFLQIFHAVSMFCELGEEFSQSGSFKLQGSLRSISKQYFMGFHKGLLDKFRLMMENESWQQLDGFTMKDVCENIAPSREIKSQSSIYAEYAKKVRSFLHSESPDCNPFRIAMQKGSFEISSDETKKTSSNVTHHDWSDDEDEDEDDDTYDDDSLSQSPDTKLMRFDQIVSGKTNGTNKQQQQVKKKRHVKHEDGPIFTNTSVSIVRRTSVYLHAMEILQPISVDVFFALSTMFKFYLYTVHSHFARTSGSIGREAMYPERDSNVPDRLHATFDQIRRSLNKCVEVAAASSNINVDGNKIPYFFELVRLSDVIDITSAPLYGIVERSIAAESLLSLLEVVKIICPKLREMLPKPKVHYVDHFLRNMEESVYDVRRCIYTRVMHMITNMESYPVQVEKCKWTVQAALQQNDYVASFLKDFKELNDVLEQVGDRLPSDAPSQLWDVAIHDAMFMLTEGYARVKKCNNEGRAQMQLDLTNFIDGVQNITNVRPLPHTERVRGYIQAYYYPPDDIWSWIQSNGHSYTSKQLINLVNVGPGTKMSKKQKVDILQKIDELEKNNGTLSDKALYSAMSDGVRKYSKENTEPSGTSSNGPQQQSSGGASAVAIPVKDNDLVGDTANNAAEGSTSSNLATSAFGSFAGKLRQPPTFVSNMLALGKNRNKPLTPQQDSNEKDQ